MRTLMLAGALASALLCGTALTEAAGAADIKNGGSMIVTYKDDVATLDPAIGYDWQNWSMIKALFDGLMDYEPGTTTLRPNLAESYEMSADGMTYTFKLRPGSSSTTGGRSPPRTSSIRSSAPSTPRPRAPAPASSARSRASRRRRPATAACPASRWSIRGPSGSSCRAPTRRSCT